MKDQTYILLLLIFSICLITACSEDKGQACVAPSIAENIIGTWTSNGSDNSVESTITFNDDGTGMDSSDQGFFIEDCIVEIVSEFTWDIEDVFGQKRVAIHFTASSCTSSYSYQVVKNDCDFIELNVLIKSVELTRL